IRATREQSNTITVLEHEIWLPEQVNIAAANTHYRILNSTGQRESTEWLSDNVGGGCKDAQVIKVAPVVGDAAGGQLAKMFTCSFERLLVRSYCEHHVIFSEDQLRVRRCVSMIFTNRSDLNSRGQILRHFCDALPNYLSTADRNFENFLSRA